MKRIWAAVAAIGLTLSLAACSYGSAPTELPPYVRHDGPIRVVASLKVWADIAAIVGGDYVESQAIITSDNQDPHSYEATAKDQLAVNQADLTIQNGGGYDEFFSLLEQKSPNQKRYMQSDISFISAAAADNSSPVKLNEHVWYDLESAKSAAGEIAYRLSLARPEKETYFQANATLFSAKVDMLINAQKSMREGLASKKIILTEALTAYMVYNLGIKSATPKSFAEAIENETDAPPAALKEIKNLISSKQVDAVVITQQTGSSQSDLIQSWAKAAGVPVLSFSESQPDSETYISWMRKNLDEFAKGLKWLGTY
jgi:zinc/manganese transport system substrate-binding protein